MKNYTLSKEKIAELEALHRSLRDKRQADRVKAVIALSKGWSAAHIAEILLFDEKTSRHYFERYQQGGLPALLDDSYSGAEPKLDTHHTSELEAYLEEHIFLNAKSVIAHILPLRFEPAEQPRRTLKALLAPTGPGYHA